MPFLWFDSNAEEAVDFYLTVFKNSRRLDEVRTVDDSESRCGWLKDRFGLSWQIVPARLPDLIKLPCRPCHR